MTNNKAMTKFKDVAHLYIGCKVETVHYVNNHNNLSAPVIEAMSGYHYDCLIEESSDFHRITPILRKLADMTEDEAKQLLGLAAYNFSGNKIESISEKDGIDHSDGELGFNSDWEMLNARQFHYLLSLHFDLFGLIESNQAIDASTLK